MFGWFARSRNSPAASPAMPPAVPDDLRVYAIGDIHGRVDLLEDMLAMITADHAAEPVRTEVVFLGDYIDRGPASAAIIERLASPLPDFASWRFLAGNHEDAMSSVLAGNFELMSEWIGYGGLETLESYGISRREMAAGGIILDNALSRIPPHHRAFLAALEHHAVIGDYVFVHAGIRPGVVLARQDRRDLLSIRQPFLDDDRDHGFVVVHGHSISDTVETRHNRIGIDTGAYRSGRLTALVLEGASRRLLQTGTGTG
ncbi:metallophosphoesterase [Polymorphobacter multimanifer]|uniref:Serine/threonine protein phosphatase 1 n=1 Tax=Polymorphobacter multimanifer TaxID=1070431 RepID=A0A841L7I8_9SPHN|nr:metallophosphoesterase [Polymorphobacter multimanifer]MBB6228544.1 serine/threonine protein phosphatase 1 [Polymorphobacter multimanifer]GGI75348.1 metallophosphoesterase [Polymorphobacter multimanifer]